MFLYVLPLENNCWYVGTTEDLQKRYEAHAKGRGAAWTKLHKPLSMDTMKFWEIPHFSLFQVEQMEDVLCKALQKKFGLNMVRGGYTCQLFPMKVRPPRHKLRESYNKHKFGKKAKKAKRPATVEEAEKEIDNWRL